MISPVKIWRRQKEIRENLGKRGVILTWTNIVVAGVEFKTYAPYPVALVKLDDGTKMFGQIVDATPAEIKIGQKVAVTLRKARKTDSEGVIAYGLKLKLVRK